MTSYKVIIQPTALKHLKGIRDRRIQTKIIESIDGLSEEPEKQGKPLTGDLAGYWSLRVVGQRYRVLYQINQGKVTVFVVALGIRKEGSQKDVYALAKKLIRQKLID